MERFLALPERPAAVVAARDERAVEILAVLTEQGLKVPKDISVLGFDDNPAAIYGPVALTTIKQPLFQMAEDAVRYLHAVITGKRKSPVKDILKPQLVVRESCSSPAKS